MRNGRLKVGPPINIKNGKLNKLITNQSGEDDKIKRID